MYDANHTLPVDPILLKEDPQFLLRLFDSESVKIQLILHDDLSVQDFARYVSLNSFFRYTPVFVARQINNVGRRGVLDVR